MATLRGKKMKLVALTGTILYESENRESLIKQLLIDHFNAFQDQISYQSDDNKIILGDDIFVFEE